MNDKVRLVLVLAVFALVAWIVVGLVGDDSLNVSRDPGQSDPAETAPNGTASAPSQVHARKPLKPASREVLLVKVLDRDTGEVVPGAVVTLRPWIGPDAKPSTAATSSTGECRFAITPPRLIKIGVKVAGYRHEPDRLLSIRSSQSVTLELTRVAADHAGKGYMRVMVVGSREPTDVDFTVLAASTVTSGYSHVDDWKPAGKGSVRTYPACLEILRPGTYYIKATTGSRMSSHMAVRVIEGKSSAVTMKLESAVRVVNDSDVALSYSYSILLDGSFLRAPVATVGPRKDELVPAGIMVAISRPHVLVRGLRRESKQVGRKFARLSPGDNVVAVVPVESTRPFDELRIFACEPGHSYVVGIEGEIERGRPSKPAPYPVLGARFFAAPGQAGSQADGVTTLRWPRVEHNCCGLYLSMGGQHVRLATLATPSGDGSALRGGALGALQLTGGIARQLYVIERRLADGESMGTSLANAMLDVGYMELDARGEALIPLVAGFFYRVCLAHRGDLLGDRGTALDFRVAKGAATLLDVSRLQSVPEKRVLRWEGAAVSSASQSEVPDSALVGGNRIQLVQPVSRALNTLRVVLADGTELVYSAHRLWKDGTEALPSGRFQQRAIPPSAEQAPNGCATTIRIGYGPSRTSGKPRFISVAARVNANGWVEMSSVSESELRRILKREVRLLGSGEEIVLQFSRDGAGDLRYRLLSHWRICALFIDADGLDVDTRGPIVAIDDPQGGNAKLEVLRGRASARLSKVQAKLAIDAYHADGSSVALSGSLVRGKEGWSCHLRR